MVRLISSIVEILFIAFILKSVFNFVRAILLRCSFFKKLKSVCSASGYSISRKNRFWRAFFGMSRKAPDLVIENAEQKYCISFITCQARKRFYYFINEQYYVRGMKLYTWLPMAKKTTTSTLFKVLKKLPVMTDEFLTDDKKVQHILLFNPAPIQIAHLHETRTYQTIDGNGSTVYNWIIYDAPTFFNQLNNI